MSYVVQPYKASAHNDDILEAFQKRTGRELGGGGGGLQYLPPVGFVCYDAEGRFVCCLFLQLTDSGVARLESFLVREGLQLKDYEHPMNLVREACEACAKELGYTCILVTTYPHLCRYIEQHAGYSSYAKRFSASVKYL